MVYVFHVAVSMANTTIGNAIREIITQHKHQTEITQFTSINIFAGIPISVEKCNFSLTLDLNCLLILVFKVRRLRNTYLQTSPFHRKLRIFSITIHLPSSLSYSVYIPPNSEYARKCHPHGQETDGTLN